MTLCAKTIECLNVSFPSIDDGVSKTNNLYLHYLRYIIFNFEKRLKTQFVGDNELSIQIPLDSLNR